MTTTENAVPNGVVDRSERADTMSAATQASLPFRVSVRWYQVAVVILGLALAAVTALAIYLAANNPIAAVPPSAPGTSSPGTSATTPCWEIHVHC
jgi:hypothetical protein